MIAPKIWKLLSAFRAEKNILATATAVVVANLKKAPAIPSLILKYPVQLEWDQSHIRVQKQLG